METRKPTEHHEKLARFVGHWNVAEMIRPSPSDPNGAVAEGWSEYRMGCDGFFLLADYEQRRDGEVTFRGHGVYGWDAKASCFTMHWFDSMGVDPGAPAPGQWTDDTLVFARTTGHARYTYRWQSQDRFTFAIEHSRDGESWERFLDSVYTRRD